MAEKKSTPYYPIHEDVAKRSKDMECIQPVNDEVLSEDEVEQSDGGMRMS